MDVQLPAAVERLPRHKQRLIAACDAGLSEPDVLGMAIAGSFVEGAPDEYSDLDLRVVVTDGSFEHVFLQREAFVRASGPVVAAFTGEHVGEPNLLITLYSDLVHVDYLFTELREAGARNEGRRVHVLWCRDDRVADALSRPFEENLPDDLARMEARMWTWVWYIQAKIMRGELWEAVSGISFLRDSVVFRLLAMANHTRYRGARFAEELAGEHQLSLERTHALMGAQPLIDALRETTSLYLELADPLLGQYGVQPELKARGPVLSALEAGLEWKPLSV